MTISNMLKELIISFMVFTTIFSCSHNREYLTDEEKNWNPYNKGQMIVFKSEIGLLDSIFIEDVLYQFPDGLGVVDYYEILSVVAHHSDPKYDRKSNTYWFSVFAKTPKKASFFFIPVE